MVGASGSPSRFTGPLGHKAALAACSHELDLQRETHRWSERDSNRRSLSRVVREKRRSPPPVW